MKAEALEFDGCFSIRLIAETMEEAAVLVRMGMNRTDEIRTAETSVNSESKFETCVVFGKSKRSNSYVPRRK